MQKQHAHTTEQHETLQREHDALLLQHKQVIEDRERLRSEILLKDSTVQQHQKELESSNQEITHLRTELDRARSAKEVLCTSLAAL